MPTSAREDLVHLRRRERPADRRSILDLLETTPARVAAPPPPTEADEPIPDEDLEWVPRELPRAVRSRRNFRIPVVVIALALAAFAYAGIQASLGLPRAWAEERMDRYEQALLAVQDTMPGLEAAAAAITDPTTGDLTSYRVSLVGTDTAAARLEAAGAETPPPDLLLVPDQDLELLPPLQDRMRTIAADVTGIGRLLTDIADYRQAFARMFRMPDLPGPNEGPSVDLMADRLSAMLTETIAVAGDLPHVDDLAPHRTEVARLIEWLPEWQAAYLHALRDGDVDLAGGLMTEAELRIGSAGSGLTEALVRAGGRVEEAISNLRREVETALVLAS
jgi:hypothetical protein